MPPQTSLSQAAMAVATPIDMHTTTGGTTLPPIYDCTGAEIEKQHAGHHQPQRTAGALATAVLPHSDYVIDHSSPTPVLLTPESAPGVTFTANESALAQERNQFDCQRSCAWMFVFLVIIGMIVGVVIGIQKHQSDEWNGGTNTNDPIFNDDYNSNNDDWHNNDLFNDDFLKRDDDWIKNLTTGMNWTEALSRLLNETALGLSNETTASELISQETMNETRNAVVNGTLSKTSP